MGIKSAFGFNKTLAAEGTWIKVPHAVNADGTIPEFRLARMGQANPKYAAALDKAYAPFRKLVEAKIPIDPQKDRAASIRVFSDTICLEWKNVQYPNDGEVLDYSRDNVVFLMTEEPELFTYLTSQAQDIENYKDTQVEQDSGN